MISLGTDCSGIEAPVHALRQLRIPFVHEFASEIDSDCIKNILANTKPRVLYGDPTGPFPNGDIRLRNHAEAPGVDLYVCGFPCQPFSTAGKNRGNEDPRGNVFAACAAYVEQKLPRYFLFENVPNILRQHEGESWAGIEAWLDTARALGYAVDWRVLNTKNYGVPQHRQRLYIVGRRDGRRVLWPASVPKCKRARPKDLVDREDLRPVEDLPVSAQAVFDTAPKGSVFIDAGFKNMRHCRARLFSPCLISNHASTVWCVPMRRLANSKEWLRLQGFDDRLFRNAVTDAKLRRQLGNSMSVNVVAAILRTLLRPEQRADRAYTDRIKTGYTFFSVSKVTKRRRCQAARP